jgi:hypothetical protein
MGEIRSTLDIIMEKTKGLTMTEDEKRELRRKDLGRKVKGLIQKFSDGFMDLDRLKIELAALGKGHEDMLRRIIMEEVAGRIQPETDNEPFLEILDATTGMHIDLIRQMLIDLERNLEKERAAHEKGLKKRLKERGISGSAVIPNLDADSQWRDYESKQKETFRREVEALTGQ